MLHMSVQLLGHTLDKLPEAIHWAAEDATAEALDDVHCDPRIPPVLQLEAGVLLHVATPSLRQLLANPLSALDVEGRLAEAVHELEGSADE
eukprot:scaffold3340_cov255-Pinguiococcus_pyrenoidosus.AAC.8